MTAPSLFKKINRALWYIAAALIILAALFVSITALLTPVLNQHRADFEKLASNLLQMPVTIREVNVEWRGYTPQISLHNVTLIDSVSLKPKVNLKELRINFSIWHSLFSWRLYIKNITVSGADLTITKQESGEVQIGSLTSLNIKDRLTGSSVKTDAMFAWIFSQPRLALENIDITYITPDEPVRLVTLEELALQNINKTHHIIDGKAVLHQLLPIKVHVHMGWDGDVRKLTQAKGHAYIYLEGLSLPQWFSQMQWQGAQIKQGIASIKLWLNWDEGQWQKVQTIFEIYNLELYSKALNQTEDIDRFGATLGWRRQGNIQTLAGEQIYIDLPYHLWPVTSFSAMLMADAAGKLHLNSLQLNYLNLEDVMRIVTMVHSAIPLEQWEKILALNPRGEVRNFNISVPASLVDIPAFKVNAQFSGLTWNSWQQYPGFANLNGVIAWNKGKGDLKLDDKNIFIAMPKMFVKPLYFNHLTADVSFEEAADNSWQIKSDNINLANTDLDMKSNFSIKMPNTGSPDINFSAAMTIFNAAHISTYSPERILDPDLAKWLKQAFRKGSATANLVVQGKLDDFPFVNNNGKFQVALQVKDLDFSFAPDWPSITNANGQVVFTGHTMKINLLSGKIARVPLQNVSAIIPYLGNAAPQVLSVDGMIHSDFASGLQFVHVSPLEQTLGKDLHALNLSGLMDLKLSLSIPLKTPKATKVLGNIGMSDAVLNLPAWKLVLNHLKGNFEFSDVGMSGKNIQAMFFGSPASLNLTTLPTNPKKSLNQLRIDFASNISITTLESLTSLSLSQIALGTSPFTAQILVIPHKENAKSSSTQVTLLSDLRGVSLNLPEPYAKKSQDSKNLQVQINGDETDQLKILLNYAKQISAAITLKTLKQNFVLQGGEIAFGGQDAHWQTAKGILITGRMQNLNVDTWRDYFSSLHLSANNNVSANANKNKVNFGDQLKMLRSIDLSVGLLKIMDQELKQVRFKLTPESSAWQINLDSSEIAGQITLPFDLKKGTVQGKFSHLYLNALQTSKARQNIDPHDLPAMNLEGNDIRAGEIHVDHLTIDAVPSPSGLIIRQVRIDEPQLNLMASGSWTGNAARSTTHLLGQMQSPKVSAVLNDWGFNSSNFICDKGQIKFDLNWAAAPFQPELTRLSGSISFDFGEGRIVQLSDSSNAKIGLGRLLNIFSLSTIPRRLSLDFSDVTQKGYSFDYMKGDFALHNGNAQTSNMRIDGPIAKVEITGRVGLAKKDLDVKLAVTPYVTGSLPAIAAFAGGPIIGVAALVVDKVVSSSVSQAITYHYNVTGPWSNPSWAQISSLSPTIFPTPSQFPMENHHVR